jgi:tetratricopeptide (TPR) repeat protein
MTDDLLDTQNTTEDAAETNAAAVALALDGASARPELSGAIAAFLREQRRLMEEQREQLRDQVKRLRLGIIDQRFSIALKAMTALIGLAIAGVFGVMVWDAYGSGGLVIEPFSVPSDLAARGLTGQVVASKLLDRLAVLQAQTDSQRDPQTYTNYWGDDIKVQIPETGVSLGDLDRYLRETLGHPIKITGEVVEAKDGLVMSARAGTEGSGSARGDDIDSLTQHLAESLYGITEPYRYGAWLREQGRNAEGIAVFTELAKHGPAAERAWGFLGIGNALQQTEGVWARLAVMARVGRESNNYLALQNVGVIEDAISRPEAAVADLRTIVPLLAGPSHGDIRLDVVPIAKKRLQALIDLNFGTFREASALWEDQVAFGPQGVLYSMHAMLARAEVGEHDLSAARRTMADPSEPGGIDNSANLLDNAWAHMLVDTEAQNWRGVIADDAAFPPLFATYPGLRTLDFARELPWLAYAHARLGDFAIADALIARTPDDCDICLRTRAQIAELEGRHTPADWWFARDATQQPSIPFAETDWGVALLARGDAAGAIAKFKSAHAKGPHFADPLELWGEALMAQNRSDLALAKFEETDKYAPNWGRLHLKWGEALFWSGDKDGAKTQFALAASLDLSAADKSELARVSHG